MNIKIPPALCRRLSSPFLYGGKSLLLVALFMAAFSAFATNGSITGTVVDNNGNPLANIRLKARDTNSGREWAATTNNDGVYFFFSLEPGSYQLEFTPEGFEPQIKSATLRVGQKLTVDFTAVSGAVSEELTVSYDVPAVDLRESNVGLAIRREQMERLPVAGNNVLSLATLAPGAKPEGGGVGNGSFSSGALSATSVGFYIDGSDRKNELVEGGMAGQFLTTSNAFPMSAISEYQVSTQLYKAEFAKATGGVFSVATKSGTNTLGGSLFFLHQSKGLNSKNALASTKPDYEYNQIGFSAGGPIIKDKLHYFLSYEDTDIEQSKISNASGIWEHLGGTFPSPSKQKLGFLRLTYHPSEAHYIDLSFDGRDENNIQYPQWWPQPMSEDRGIVFTNDISNLNLKYQYTSGTMLHEFRVNYQDYEWGTAPIAGNGIEGRRYPSVHYGPFSHAPQDWAQERQAFNYDLSIGFSKHFIKTGVSVQKLDYNAYQAFWFNPQFDYALDTSPSPYIGRVSVGDAGVSSENTQLGFFVQDDWTVNDRLVVNLGVRYDRESNMLNNDFVTPQAMRDALAGELDDKYLSDGNNRKPFSGAVQPRIGFTYDLTGDGEKFLFGGFGIAYDRAIWNVAADESIAQGRKDYEIYFSEDGSTGIQWDDSYYDRAALLNLIESGEVPPPGVHVIPDDLKPPKTQQYSIGYRQRLEDATISVNYVGVRGSEEIDVWNANADGHIEEYGRVMVWSNAGDSKFDALYFLYDRPSKNGWFGQVAYTLGKAENETPKIYHGYWNYTSEDDFIMGPANSDERHRLTLNMGVELPWNIQLSGIGVYASGLPIAVVTGTDDNGDGNLTNDFPEGKGRNSERGDAQKNLNLRLNKLIDLKSLQMQLYVDVFNVFDWTNYTSYIGNQQSAQFLQPTSAGSPRQVQLGASVNF